MIIEMNDLTKSFGENTVLDGITIQLSSGKFYALLGRNGSGKSTLMKILMRLELPTTGSFKFLGRPYSEDYPEYNENIGYVSENIAFGTWQSIETFFKSYQEMYPKWDIELFNKLLQIQKLDKAKRFCDFSRGQKMQIALASALAIHPKILLLDEITSVLDAGARSFFLKYLSTFKQNGGTILMATNIVSEVQYYAEHLILLEDKKIKIDTSISEVSDYFLKLRRNHDDNREIFSKHNCVDVGINPDGTISFMIPVSEKENYQIEGVLPDKRRITVEEIFIYYTGKGEI